MGQSYGDGALESMVGATGLVEAVGSADPGGGAGGAQAWSALGKFLVQYFVFLRDVDVGNLAETYDLLSEVVQ